MNGTRVAMSTRGLMRQSCSLSRWCSLIAVNASANATAARGDGTRCRCDTPRTTAPWVFSLVLVWRLPAHRASCADFPLFLCCSKSQSCRFASRVL